jgi:restriction system protein
LHEFRKSLKEKGDSYEKYVSGYFRGQGYTIAEHGLDNGRKDHGIDVIVKKHKEIIFVQCKNWKVSDKHKIDHRHIKEFIGNCTTYMEKNPMYGMYAVKRYFAVSDEIMDYSAERFISENPQSIQKLLLTMPEE